MTTEHIKKHKTGRIVDCTCNFSSTPPAQEEKCNCHCHGQCLKDQDGNCPSAGCSHCMPPQQNESEIYCKHLGCAESCIKEPETWEERFDKKWYSDEFEHAMFGIDAWVADEYKVKDFIKKEIATARTEAIAEREKEYEKSIDDIFEMNQISLAEAKTSGWNAAEMKCEEESQKVIDKMHEKQLKDLELAEINGWNEAIEDCLEKMPTFPDRICRNEDLETDNSGDIYDNGIRVGESSVGKEIRSLLESLKKLI